MKKVAFIHDIYPGGGAERVTLDIAKYLAEHHPEYKCYVFTPKIIQELRTEEINRLLTIRQIRHAAKYRSIDVEKLVAEEGINLIVQTVRPLIDIEKICKRHGCKSIFANHGEPFWERYGITQRRRKSFFYRPLWKAFWRGYFEDKGHARDIAIKRNVKYYRNNDAYTVLCDGYKAEVCHAFGIKPEESRIYAIENAEPVAENVSYDKEKIILYCGRLSNMAKRLDRLFRIWAKVQQRIPDYRLQIVGDGTYRESMIRQIESLKLERVEMVGWSSNVDKYYRKASVVCLTSQTEGWPLCMTEAQAKGCIPVAFGCSAGIRDILSPSGVNGFIVTPFDEDEYAETLIHIASMSDQERDTIRRSAVVKRAQYAPEILMKKWADLFEKLLG